MTIEFHNKSDIGWIWWGPTATGQAELSKVSGLVVKLSNLAN